LKRRLHAVVERSAPLRTDAQAGMDHTARRAPPPKSTRSRSSSASTQCARSFSVCGCRGIASACVPSPPVASGCRQAPMGRSPILRVRAGSSTGAVAQAPQTALAPSHRRPSGHCRRTGPPPAIRWGSCLR
jgi:hypothetical protein